MSNEHQYEPVLNTRIPEETSNSYLQTAGSYALPALSNIGQFTATALQRAGRIGVLVGGYSAVIEGQFQDVWDSLDGKIVTTSTSLNSDIHADGQFSTNVDNVGGFKVGGHFDKSFPIGGTFSQEILLDLPSTNLAQPSIALVAGGLILGAAGIALERLVKKKEEPISPTAEILDTLKSAEDKAYYYGMGTYALNFVADLAGMYAVSNIAFNNSVKKGEHELDSTFLIPSVQPFQKERDFSFELNGPDYTGGVSGRANLRGSIYAETNVDLSDIKSGLLEGIDRNEVYLLSAYAAAGFSMLCQYGASKLHEQEKHYTGIVQELKTRERVEAASRPRDIEEGSCPNSVLNIPLSAQSNHSSISSLSTPYTDTNSSMNEERASDHILASYNVARNRSTSIKSDPGNSTAFAGKVVESRIGRSLSL